MKVMILLPYSEGAADGANIVLVSGSFVLGDYALNKSVIISGYDKANMPTIYGRHTTWKPALLP